MHNQPISYRQYLRGACLALAATTCITGCVQPYPIPNAVRSGDTLVLGLGGIQRNAKGNQNLRAGDLQITLTDHDGNSFVLNSNGVFKAFPDYGSILNYSAINGALPVKPFDGGWFVSVPLVVSEDGPHQGEALPLAVGSATVAIESNNKLTNTGVGQEGDLSSIPVEILAGVGDAAKTEAYNSQFAVYSRPVMVSIAPYDLTGITSVGGLQLAITYPQSAAYLDASHPPVILPNSHNPYIQIAQNIVSNDNGTNTINVLLTAQKGFSSPANQTPFTPLLSDLTVQIMYFLAPIEGPLSDEQLLDTFKIDPVNSYYVDLNGHVMSLQPIKSIQN